MPRPKPDKQAMLADLTAHVLAHGLNTASLRPLAQAAGTSDRMLIYHFGSKEALVADMLRYLAAQMAAGLDAALPPARMASEAELVAQVVGLMRSDPFRPYCRLWFDILSGAAQGQEAHRDTGQEIAGIFLDWMALRHPEGRQGAAFALALVEGILVLDTVGAEAAADAALSRLER